MNHQQHSASLHKPRSSISVMLRKFTPNVFGWITGSSQPSADSTWTNNTQDSPQVATPITFSSPTSPSNVSLNSHVPLVGHNFPSAAATSQGDETVPETLNEMDAEAKARAVKKARKISRVFGEIPILAPEPTPERAKSSDVTTGQRRAASLGIFRIAPDLGIPRITRPATTGTPGGSQPRNLSCPIPPANTIPLPLDTHTEVDEDPQILTPRQARRVSMAKLTRHLGENIPPELISPIVREETLGPPAKGKLRRPHSSKGRKSLDAITFSKQRDDLPKAPLKRSSSLWTRKKGEEVGASLNVDPAFRERYNSSFGNEEEVRARCKALRVRRVRKVRQLLGQEPPSEFIQAIASDPERILSLGEGYRDSVATIVSYFRSSTNLIRSRSVSTTTSEAGFITAPEEEGRLSTPRTPSLDTSLAAQSRRASISSIQSYAMPSFRERRIRIAKLIRFFGVDYQNISDSVRQSDEHSQVEAPRTTSGEGVDIKIDIPGRFWGLFERHQDKEANLGEVIGRLRDLRAGPHS